MKKREIFGLELLLLFAVALTSGCLDLQGKAIIPEPPNVLTSDTFDRTSMGASTNASLGGKAFAYKFPEGTMGIDKNVVAPTAQTNGVAIAVVDTGFSNCVATIRLVRPSTASVSFLAFRNAGTPLPSDGLSVQADFANNWGRGSTYVLLKSVGNNNDVLASASVPPQSGDVIRVEFFGSAIKVLINGVTRISIQDDTHLTKTHVGFGFAGDLTGRFDDFLVEDCY